MNSSKAKDLNLTGTTKDVVANHGKLTVKSALKAGELKKPRLYNKTQALLATIKRSLSEDIVQARND